MILFVLFLAALLLVCFQGLELSAMNFRCCLTAVFAFGLVLRVAGLDWGIPVHDAETAKGAPGLRVSFHPDEDNFLWNLVRVRPEKLDFAVNDFHWGTLQYHLITLALLLAQALDVVSSPWRESFLGFHPVEYARIFVTGRAVSAILGSCCSLSRLRHWETPVRQSSRARQRAGSGANAASCRQIARSDSRHQPWCFSCCWGSGGC